MIHHITILARDPNKLKKFYGDVLGLTLLEQSYSADDPKTPHLVFGNSAGKILLTFLIYPKAHRGSVGRGSVSSVNLAVTKDSLETWRQRLRSHKVRDESDGLSFVGPDGVCLGLVRVEGEGDEILGLRSIRYLCSDETREFWRECFGSSSFVEFAKSEGRAELGYGSVHHVALTHDGTLENSLVPGLSPVKNREGFHSRYFYDPDDGLWELLERGLRG